MIRFWSGTTIEKLVRLPTHKRAELLSGAKSAALQAVLRLPPHFSLELSSLCALAAPIWARLESGNAAQVALCVEELRTCEACHLAQLEAALPSEARLKYLMDNGLVRFLFFGDRKALCPSPGCLELHTISENEFASSWALARRLAVQEVMVLVGIMLSHSEVGAFKARPRALLVPSLPAFTLPSCRTSPRPCCRADSTPWSKALRPCPRMRCVCVTPPGPPCSPSRPCAPRAPGHTWPALRAARRRATA